jgi:hypothetical protein
MYILFRNVCLVYMTSMSKETLWLCVLGLTTQLVFRNFGLFNFAGTFPELTENLGVSSAELTNRDSRSSLPDPTRWPNRKQ